MDIGCGTGKYINKFFPLCKEICGIDKSQNQIDSTKEKTNNKVQLFCCDATNLPFGNGSFDIVVSTWVFGTILDIDVRNRALAEANRVLKNGGKIYLVENDIGGEFEEIRNRYPDTSKTLEYNNYLIKNGFTPILKEKTFFKFDSTFEAKEIFEIIWDFSVAEKITKPTIEQNVVIFEKTK